MSTSSEIKDGYTSTLQDLTFNSKPLISVLTMLAEENSAHAKVIVEAIEEHLTKVRNDVKLPVLYLIDCIIKNVGGPYLTLFCQNIVSTFCTVFEKVDERTRAEMFKLRQTWNEILPPKKLYALDVQIHLLDPAWPVTAAPPSNSIHFNPKFLKTTNSQSTKKEVPVKPVTSTILPVNASTLDPETLDMQQKLIVKQKELLELQQKKLELELLQAQVKLQEQLKQQQTPTFSSVQNPLLKADGSKIAAISSTEAVNPKPKVTYVNSSLSSSLMSQKLQNTSSSSGRIIAPVNSNLVSAVRQNRDPRLLRQQQQGNGCNVNSNVQLEIKNNQSVSVDTDNKIVNSKLSVRDNRTEPRLVINKDAPLLGKATKALPRIPLKNSSKHPDSYRKTPKSSRNSKSSANSDGGSSSKGSTSSLDSPTKCKIDKTDSSKSNSRSPIKSPTKHKKKEISSSRNDKKCEKSNSKNSRSENRICKSDGLLSTTFKELKGSTKNRNYIRRNREKSTSPEPSFDVDLRVAALMEKDIRLPGDAAEDTSLNVENTTGQRMDIDLRQLPAVINKKRSSTDALELMNSKKSKSEMFDVLFGNEDTDLRQLPGVSPTKNKERPPTPPPPIISNDSRLEENTDRPMKDSPKARNFEEIRLKLANATGKSKFTSGDLENRDLKTIISSNVKNKILISPADEQCIKDGNLTKAQEQALMNKIIAQIENQKLREAKRIDNEENVSLQPISDDELDAEYERDHDDDSNKKNLFSDNRDKRVSLNNAPSFGSSDFHSNKYTSRSDTRRTGSNWRGGRRRQGSGLPTHRAGIRTTRPTVDPWIKSLNPHAPWRPINQTFPKPLLDNNFLTETEIILNKENENTSNALTTTIITTNNNSETPDLVVEAVNQDDIKSINIDGIQRDVRYYDETAIAFMSWDDPREISFQNGSRRVIFDDKDVFVLNFNEPYRDVTLNGSLHQIRLGTPTRELYIDGKWYECYFGGPGIGVEIDGGKVVIVKLDGPPPQVKIGDITRTDLVAGKINLIIDAKTIVPVYLDAKIQKFDIDSKVHNLQFVDALRTVLINDVQFKVEFGGLPKPITVNGNKHFIRFSVLPKGIKPGYVDIKDMPGSRINSPKIENENSQDSHPPFDLNVNSNEPALPVMGKKKKRVDSPERNSNSPFQYLNVMQQQSLNNLDVLSSVMSGTTPVSQSLSSYQATSVTQPTETIPTTIPSATATAAIPTPLLSANINDLFQKLVATGIITSETQAQQQDAKTLPLAAANNKKEKPCPTVVRPVYFDKIDTLKLRQSALIESLYAGMQCSSCGMRFPPEQSTQYSQHLDWHFRQNRKGKKNIRKASSRKWYYSLADWKNYEEIEDLEEKEKNFFDQQQNQGEIGNDEQEDEIEISSVPADPNVQDPRCDVCQDRFEQFYNEEKEEWHLRMAIRVDGKTYHPLCYEDYQDSTMDNSMEEVPVIEENSNDVGVIPGLEVPNAQNNQIDEIIIDDTDSIVTENSTKIEIDSSIETNDQKTNASYDDDEDDDDVIIHEVVPERIILDDDDYKEETSYPTYEPTPINIVKKEPIDDDGFMDVEDGILKTDAFDNIQIKPEPIDQDESMMEGIIMEEDNHVEHMITDAAPHTEVVASMDGNVEFESGVTHHSTGISGKIKINITKPLPVLNPPKETNKDLVCDNVENDKESIDPSQPLPPGEEPVQLYTKPTLKDVNLKKLPPVKRGSELTGLCAIM